MSKVRIAVAGTGEPGKRQAEQLLAAQSAELAAIVEPAPNGPETALQYRVQHYPTLEQLLDLDPPDGVILATPNRLPADAGLICVEAGIPVLVERPIADSAEAASVLVEAGAATGVPILTGHHRQYSPIMASARAIIRSGRLGPLVAVVGTALCRKPDEYFEIDGGWRREPGGGPVLLNLAHDVNTLLSLVGDIVGVQAVTSNATRRFPVEDTAAMIFRFANGALGTFLLSDVAGSPRSWEQTSQENNSFAPYPEEDCYHIAGTRGSLSIPTLRCRLFPGKPSWNEPFEESSEDVERADPFAKQIEHFAAVIRGRAEPIVSGRDGLNTLRVVDAVQESARTGRSISL
jgi:predicted dehydrogenase